MVLRTEQTKKRRDRGQRMLRRGLLFLSALILVAGLAQRFMGQENLQVTGVASPTTTPIAGAWDETVETREITLMPTTWYAIQTGVYTDEQSAILRAEAYTERGAPGVVIGDGTKWRVLIASFGQEKDAAAVRTSLSGQQGVDTYLYTWVCPELRLRMTGMAGQLDVAEAGLQQVLTAAERLRDAAIDLDMGQITRDDVMQMLQDIDAQLRVWSDTAQKRFSRPYPALITSELGLVSDWSLHRQTIAQVEDVTTLSAALKCHAMQLYERVIMLRTTLQSS